jgi:hypothetical protein
MRRLLAIPILWCWVQSLFGGVTEPPRFRRFLVPVVDTAGVVQWRTTLWLHNSGDVVLHPFPLISHTGTGFPVADTTISAHETLMTRNVNSPRVQPFEVPLTKGGEGGAVVYVEAQGGEAMRGRVEVSGNGSLPTVVPVVGEGAFRNAFRIEPVPESPGARYLLRIYSLDGPEGAAVTVHVRALYPLGLREDQTIQVRLHASQATLECLPSVPCLLPHLQYTPYFAAVPLGPAQFYGPYDILVESDRPDVAIWGMLSITTNCGNQGCATVFVPWE